MIRWGYYFSSADGLTTSAKPGRFTSKSAAGLSLSELQVYSDVANVGRCSTGKDEWQARPPNPSARWLGGRAYSFQLNRRAICTLSRMKQATSEYIVDWVEAIILAAALGVILWWLVFYPV